MGLRMVKKTVNQDQPTIYHLFYGDEEGAPGHDLTFFEFPGVERGKAGAGMVHRLIHRVGSADTLDFWADRLGGEGVDDEARERVARVPGPRGPRARARRLRGAGPAADRARGRGPGRARAPGVRGRPRLHARSRGQPDAARGGACVRAALRHRVGGARRGARRPGDLRHRPTRPARPGPARSITSRGRWGWTRRRSGASARSAPERTRRRSSTASGSARSTSASRAASCSSSPPRAGVHRGRAARDARRGAHAPAGLRAHARAARGRSSRRFRTPLSGAERRPRTFRNKPFSEPGVRWLRR